MRRQRSKICASVLALAMAPAMAAHAAPLDAEACAQLKLKKDALEAAGARDDLRQAVAGQLPQLPLERAQRVRSLMDVEGQLRFRCMMELPIATLKPETPEDALETVDPPAAPKAAAAKAAVPKRKKAEPPVAARAPGATPAAAAVVVPPVKAAAKARPKVDDAYRAPAAGDANGTPFNGQAGKPN